ncbi:MAG TPA: hypothetical protein VEK08_13275 [Planctomycetota bacterium]|nr:hypothetical protein [Planctomycetota bacterium]
MVTTYEDVSEKVEEMMPSSMTEKHQQEDVVTTNIERVTSKVPSGVFLGLGIACIAASASLALAGKTKQANFVGMWVPTILIMGLYNKLVKQHEPH